MDKELKELSRSLMKGLAEKRGADVLDGVLLASLIGNSGRGERPGFSDADIIAREKDPAKRERMMDKMVGAARVDDGHLSRGGATFAGGLLGGLAGADLGVTAARLSNGSPSGKLGLTAGLTGVGTGLGALGGYLIERNLQRTRRARYLAALRAKVNALREMRQTEE